MSLLLNLFDNDLFGFNGRPLDGMQWLLRR